MVNSPPSRCPIRTPASSPSPLKRVSSTRGTCLSLNARPRDGTSRKLELPLEKVPRPEALEEAVVEPMIPIAVIIGSTQVGTERLPRERIIAESSHVVLPKSTGTPASYRKKPNDTRAGLPPRGSRSLSAGEALGTTKKRKRKAAAAERPSPCDAWVGGGGPHYCSRCKDIFRGLAKYKAEEAAKASRTKLQK